ncbi:hypothetical protein ACFL1E_07125 [Candidatus Omnitrophota bacterium]
MRRESLYSFHLKVTLLSVIVLVIFLAIAITAVYAVPVPEGQWEYYKGTTIYSRGGDEYHCEFYVVGPDGEEYTVVKNNDGRWYYAKSDSTGSVIPGQEEVSAFALPPEKSKDLKLTSQAIDTLKQQREDFDSAMAQVNEKHLALLEENRSPNLVTTYQPHIVFVEFSDQPHTFEAEDFLEMIFSEDSYVQTPSGQQAYGSARDYWREVSFNQVDIEPTVHYPGGGEWFMMPETREYYDSNNRHVFYDDVISTIGIELGDDKLIIVAAGYASSPGTVFWPHTNGVNGNRMVLSERCLSSSRFLPMGVAAHELGHMLFGLGDYYYSVYYWGLMGMGCYGYGAFGIPNAEKPVHLSAINRINAGFADVETVSGEGVLELTDYVLPAVETTGKVLHLDAEDDDTQFYLEVRQPHGNVFDSDISEDSAGLVVWFDFGAYGYFPYGPPITETVGYFNPGEGSFNDSGYWRQVTDSVYPGPYDNTEIGLDTHPPFMGNQYTSIHYMADIRKETGLGLSSVVFDLERFSFKEQLLAVSIDDDNSGMSSGNGDGMLDIGERVEVVFSIENQGSEVIPASRGSFVTDENIRWFPRPFRTVELDDSREHSLLGAKDSEMARQSPTPFRSFFIPEILPGETIETRPMVFEVISEPNVDEDYQIYLVRDNQFSLSGTTLHHNWVKIYEIPSDRYRSNPSIFGNKIVWSDELSFDYAIVMYDLGADGIPHTFDEGEGEYQIATAGNLSWSPRPDIYSNWIVWNGLTDGGHSAIYVYYLGADGIPHTFDEGEGEYQLSLDLRNQSKPAIYDKVIVWEEQVDGDYEIFAYYLGADGIPHTNDEREGEYLITLSSLEEGRNPDIFDGIIVFKAQGLMDGIGYYSLGPDGIPGVDDYWWTQNFLGSVESPKTSDGNIVWQIYRDGNRDIDFYLVGDGGGEWYQIASDSILKRRPAIYGNWIIWQYDFFYSDIYAYYLGSDGIPHTSDAKEGEYAITLDSVGHRSPAIFENKVVWCTRFGDIYLGILSFE